MPRTAPDIQKNISVDTTKSIAKIINPKKLREKKCKIIKKKITYKTTTFLNKSQKCPKKSKLATTLNYWPKTA